MARFTRRQSDRRTWVAALPSPFSLEDVAAEVTAEELRDALSWLYAGIEDGRIVPEQTQEGLRYHLLARRAGDGAAAAAHH